MKRFSLWPNTTKANKELQKMASTIDSDEAVSGVVKPVRGNK